MRRVLLVPIVALLLSLRPSYAADDLIYSRFGEYLEALRVQIGVPGMAATLIGKNEILWSRAFGSQDLDRQVAMRTDTPLHFDGVTEIFSATLLMRCVEEGRLSLDETMAVHGVTGSEGDLTIRQVLTHTSGPANNLTYAFRPDRFGPMPRIIRFCLNDSYRKSLSRWYEQMAMVDSVPGADSVQTASLTEGVPTPEQTDHYRLVLGRLAKPYAVDAQRRATATTYSSAVLTPTTGAIMSVLDYAQFDLALKAGLLLRTETLTAAWRPALSASGQRLPHGIGWFVQTSGNDTVVWQFGTGDHGSSSMVVMLPSRGLTLVIAANSTGLAKSFQLTNGDLTSSPFGRVFLTTFVR
jgi:CubicO group peptidase (beta-lactamase class C family)